MDRGTQILIGGVLIAVAAAVVAVSLASGTEIVRHVSEVAKDPAASTSGRIVLVGVPDAQANGTRAVTLWRDAGGALRESLLTLDVDRSQADGSSRWTFTNVTTFPGNREAASTTTSKTWTVTGPHAAFVIRSFDGESDTPAAFWGLYRGVLNEPLAPKPSQFTGHLEGGLAAGALVWDTTDYKVGCSSKFLPPSDPNHTGGARGS